MYCLEEKYQLSGKRMQPDSEGIISHRFSGTNIDIISSRAVEELITDFMRDLADLNVEHNLLRLMKE